MLDPETTDPATFAADQERRKPRPRIQADLVMTPMGPRYRFVVFVGFRKVPGTASLNTWKTSRGAKAAGLRECNGDPPAFVGPWNGR